MNYYSIQSEDIVGVF